MIAIMNISTRKTEKTVSPLMKKLPVITSTTRKTAKMDKKHVRTVSRTRTLNISYVSISVEYEYVEVMPYSPSSRSKSFKYWMPSRYSLSFLIGVTNWRHP